MDAVILISLYFLSVFINRCIHIYLIRDDVFKEPMVWFIPLVGTIILLMMFCVRVYCSKERNSFKNFINWFLNNKE